MTVFARLLWCSCGAASRRRITCRPVLGEAEARAVIRAWVWQWMYGVAMEGKRTLDPRPDELPDAEASLFAIALRQLFRSVEWAIVHADTNSDGRRSKALRAASDAFDASVPHAVGVRDVLVHFDEYERGKGRLQEGRKNPPRLNVFTKDDGGTLWLYVLDDDDHRLDVRTALEAARDLAESVLETLSD